MVALRPDEWKPICSSASSTVTRACFDSAAAAESPAIPPPMTRMSDVIMFGGLQRGERCLQIVIDAVEVARTLGAGTVPTHIIGARVFVTPPLLRVGNHRTHPLCHSQPPQPYESRQFGCKLRPNPAFDRCCA